MRKRGSISCSAGGFAVGNGRGTAFVAGFDEIVRATAFKRDELTTDLVCVEVEMTGGETLELNEEIGGFDEWMRRIEALPGALPDWRDKVIHPPFARNETLLFTRQDRA